MKFRMVSVAACALSGLVFSSPTAAQVAPAAYPAKPLRMIVPFTPGGPADAVARPIAQGLTERLGQQVIVDYRPGAGGNIGAELAAKSPPDGYTLFVTTPGILAVNPTLYGKVPFETLRDFAGVTNAATTASAATIVTTETPDCLFIGPPISSSDERYRSDYHGRTAGVSIFMPRARSIR